MSIILNGTTGITSTGITETSDGKVGIGTDSPTSQVSFGATVGKTIAVFENAGGNNIYGIGMGGGGTVADPYRTKIFANGFEYLNVDYAGRVTMPYQPCFSARRASSQSSGGSAYVITYQATQVNIGNHLNAGTGIFTAPVTGNYLFSFSCIGPTATGSFDLYGYKNGAIDSVDFSLRPVSQDVSSYHSALASGTFIVPLAANDTFGLQIQQNNISLYSDGNNWVHFSGYLIG